MDHAIKIDLEKKIDWTNYRFDMQ